MISNKIRELRKKKGLSQEELAEQINVSRQSISKWETAKAIPDMDKIIQLSEFFNVSVNYLINEEHNNESVSKNENTSTTHNFKKKKQKLLLLSIISLVIILFVAIFFSFYKPNTIDKLSESVVLLEVYDDNNDMVATGSGFYIYDDKTIATNFHVIADAYTVIAITEDGQKFTIDKTQGYNEQKDIAILKTKNGSGINPLPLIESKHLNKGQEVIAVGSPLGIQNVVSTGIISAIHNEDETIMIQTTAPISSGSSGGVLSTKDGKVVGMTSGSFTDGQNLNLAVASDEITDLYYSSIDDRTSLKEIYNSREHFHRYAEITVGDLLANYSIYDDKKVCVTGWISTSLFNEEDTMNVVFMVEKPEDICTTGITPMFPYADTTDEYDRSFAFKSLIVANHGTKDAAEAGKYAKIYGETEVSVFFGQVRIGLTAYKIEYVD